MRVTPITVAQLESATRFAALIAEYTAESANRLLPPPIARMSQYRDLEAKGLLHVLAAVDEDGELAGFISVLASPLPKYGPPIATSESFFVAKAHRASLAGLKLLAAAERLAKALGSPVLMVSAPWGSTLDTLLQHPKCGFVRTNVVYCKQVADA